jgi:hypothetical protein
LTLPDFLVDNFYIADISAAMKIQLYGKHGLESECNGIDCSHHQTGLPLLVGISDYGQFLGKLDTFLA